MRLTVEPIGVEHRESLKRHLAPFGLPAEIVEWKYFGRASDDHRPKGFVWIRQGEVRGSIGLIPFDIATPDGRVPAAWTCDWLVDAPQDNPGIGVLLLQHAKGLIAPLFTLGGNELTARLMSRIASRCISSATIEMHVPLRVGGSSWFRAINGRAHSALDALGSIPLRISNAPGNCPVEPGVPFTLHTLLNPADPSIPSPLYSIDQVRWQIEQCPALESASCVSPPANPRAGAVCWHHRVNPEDWRLAFWSSDDASNDSGQVLDGIIRHVFSSGGARLSVLTSPHDLRRIAVLKQHGFVNSHITRPMYVTGSFNAIDKSMAGVSFLDADVGYRFYGS